MQQLQENIKKDLIEHPFRPIEIIYEPGKTIMTEQDKELLASYISVHDFHLEMMNIAKALMHESVPIKDTIMELHEKLKMVNATFDTCCEVADQISVGNYVFEEANVKKLAEAREKTESELRIHHEEMMEIYERVNLLKEKITEFHEEEERQSEILYDKLRDLSLEHSKNWENNAINVVEFDIQLNQFCDYNAISEEQRDSMIKISSEALINYTTLNFESSNLFNVWNEFVKRLDLLTSMSALHSSALGFTDN